MNKYKKALEYLKDTNVVLGGALGFFDKKVQKNYEVLQKLVDRAIPKGMIYDNVGKTEDGIECILIFCPECSRGYGLIWDLKPPFCPFCGQSLKWRKEK